MIKIVPASGLSDGDLCFLFALQDVHDRNAFFSDRPFLNYFSHSMRLLADKYKLDDSSLVLLGEQGAG